MTAGMVEMSPLQLTLPAEPASVPTARRAVSDYAERTGVDVEAVAVAVSEAVTNAVLHGFSDGGDGHIVIDARLQDGTLTVLVSDDGRGMHPNPDSPGLGFGLPMLAALSDEMGIQPSPAGGTRVTMRFAAAA